mmetsp:Transcript_44182/g.89223  ORF Transcript_44182/g.89223 Transcript_44182/m.89223 type:complete len:126 (-) Transcript_44182:19-396(-)
MCHVAQTMPKFGVASPLRQQAKGSTKASGFLPKNYSLGTNLLRLRRKAAMGKEKTNITAIFVTSGHRSLLLQQMPLPHWSLLDSPKGKLIQKPEFVRAPPVGFPLDVVLFRSGLWCSGALVPFDV